MNFLRQISLVLRFEAGIYRRYPRLLLACLLVALIPAMYVLLYLSSIWDPAARTGYLSVALVNYDLGMEHKNRVFNVGADVVDRLKSRQLFAYQDYLEEAQARASVRSGKNAFALIIPADFSANAIPGIDAGGGKLVVYLSEGNSYHSAALARKFADELAEEVNESLNRQRWELVLQSVSGSEIEFGRLRQGITNMLGGSLELTKGVKQAAVGAKSLTDGSGAFVSNANQLSAGMKDLSEGMRQMQSRWPNTEELSRLRLGAADLAEGEVEMGKGLGDVRSGGRDLGDRVKEFQAQVKDSPLQDTSVSYGIDQVAEGLSKLNSGLSSVASGQRRLEVGAKDLSVGVARLTSGMLSTGNFLSETVTKLPQGQQLQELSAGGERLVDGASQLDKALQQLSAGAEVMGAGIQFLVDALPEGFEQLGGSPEGLAHSVNPVIEAVAPVQNNGSGFAPNVISIALWLGASIAAFLMHARLMPRLASEFVRLAQVLGKVFIPTLVVMAQVMLVLLSVYLLQIPIANLPALLLVLVMSAATFLMIVFALTRGLGDAGKAIAFLLLALQVTSSGGLIPVELSGGLFAELNPWMPMTWVLVAIKASMFGAYDGQWLEPFGLVCLAGLVATVLACVVGRWRFVGISEIRRPPINF
ncbi:MAG: YhgE/Pip domain-containing protein [Hylemonella sp.]